MDWIMNAMYSQRSVTQSPAASEPAKDSVPRWQTSRKYKKQRDYKRSKQRGEEESSAKSQGQENLQLAEREAEQSRGANRPRESHHRPNVTLHYICTDCLLKFCQQRSIIQQRNQWRKNNPSYAGLGDSSSYSDVVKNGGVEESTPAGQSNELKATSSANIDSNSRQTKETTDIKSKVDDILELSNELCNKIQKFWGPLDAIKPLEDEIEAMLMNIDKLVSNNDPNTAEDIRQGKEELLYNKRILELRAPMIESYNSDDDSSASSEAAPSRIKSEISRAAMQALRLYRNLRHEPLTARARGLLMRGQFAKVQTDLDALKIEADDTEAIETRKGVLLLCNDALATVEHFLAQNNNT